MKRTVIILLAFVLTLTSCNNSDDKKQTADNSSNQSADKGKQIKDFVPENWTIIKQVSGDLNKDNAEDVVLVIVVDTEIVDDVVMVLVIICDIVCVNERV